MEKVVYYHPMADDHDWPCHAESIEDLEKRTNNFDLTKVKSMVMVAGELANTGEKEFKSYLLTVKDFHGYSNITFICNDPWEWECLEYVDAGLVEYSMRPKVEDWRWDWHLSSILRSLTNHLFSINQE